MLLRASEYALWLSGSDTDGPHGYANITEWFVVGGRNMDL
jgi:hypothetical protein